MCKVCDVENVKCNTCGEKMIESEVLVSSRGVCTRWFCDNEHKESYLYHNEDCVCVGCEELEDMMTHNDDPPPPF